jgi:hypothetical protein
MANSDGGLPACRHSVVSAEWFERPETLSRLFYNTYIHMNVGIKKLGESNYNKHQRWRGGVGSRGG